MSEWSPGLAALLGLVEGLTEFLPVSSTGHLILVGYLVGFTGPIAASVEISIQLGSILAIIVYERRKLRELLSKAYDEQRSLRRSMLTSRSGETSGGPGRILCRSMETHPHLWFLIGVGLAFLPAAFAGLVAHHWIEEHLFNPRTVAAALIAGGLVILAVEQWKPKPGISQLTEVGARTALMIGLAQCASLFPGVSRSGATIVGGMLAGLDRKTATEYSFFLALPTMVAATGYKMYKSQALFNGQDASVLVLGMAVAFLVAWAVIAAFLAFVKQHSLQPFAYYRMALGLVVLSLLA